MRIERIAIKNLLSFDDFVWDDPAPNSNLIVGPNGSGKTNLIHAVRAVVDVLSPPERSGRNRRARWEVATHGDLRGQPTEVALDLRFTTAREWRVLSAFYAASLCDEQLAQIGGHPISTRQRGRLSASLLRQLTPEHTSLLYTGRLVVRHDGAGRWSSWYESLPGQRPFWWRLEGSGVTGISATAEDRSGGPVVDALQSVLGSQSLADFFEGEAPDLRLPSLEEVVRSGFAAIALEVRQSTQSYLATHDELESAIGEKLLDGQSYGPLFLFRHLLPRCLITTENLRNVPRQRFALDESREAAVDLASGRDLGLILFRMKNGEPPEQAGYRFVQDNFRTLTGGSTFDVKMEMAPRAVRPENDDPGALDLAVLVGADGDHPKRPIEFSGAGMTEALLLATILASEPGCVVFLDEPAANLHPTIQRRLARTIDEAVDLQFFLITHSPELVLPEAITRTSRFALAGGHTRRSALGEFPSQEGRARVEQALRRSADSRALLFARAALLVEGETEFGALPLWLDEVLAKRNEPDDTVIYWAGGDGSFETLVRVLMAFDVPWAVICDGDAIANASSKGIAAQLWRAGVLAATPESSATFQMRREMLRSVGVFTFAQIPEDRFEDLPLIASCTDDARQRVGNSKARRARVIAQEHPCPTQVAAVLSQILEHWRHGDAADAPRRIAPA